MKCDELNYCRVHFWALDYTTVYSASMRTGPAGRPCPPRGRIYLTCDALVLTLSSLLPEMFSRRPQGTMPYSSRSIYFQNCRRLFFPWTVTRRQNFLSSFSSFFFFLETTPENATPNIFPLQSPAQSYDVDFRSFARKVHGWPAEKLAHNFRRGHVVTIYHGVVCRAM